MKKIFLLLFTLLTAASLNAQKKAETLPSKNKAIVAYCDSHAGKAVGEGECWDLAKEALDHAGADWTSPYEFGKLLDPSRDKVLPGDIAQFEKVKIVYPDGAWQELPHHTAIIHKVLAKGRYTIAEQNSEGRRFVVFTDIDLNYLKRGKVMIYRPQ